MTLLDELRAAGLALGTVYEPTTFDAISEGGIRTTTTRRRYVSWTTDEALADLARDSGARVVHVPSKDARFSGWEVAVTVSTP